MSLKKALIELADPNLLIVAKKYPFAYRCCDRNGYYIVNGFETREELGRGKSPAKAWAHAAKIILENKKKGNKARP